MKVHFTNKTGQSLAAQLDLPKNGKVNAYAIFAHCFTCSKNLGAVKNIARSLINEGVGLLRFDFTGLGNSEGEFADSNFSSNVDDLISAAEYMTQNYEAPKLLVGHSLGGAATLFAANLMPTVEAVATIGAPFGPGHVKHLFDHKVNEIEAEGAARVNIGGRPFTVKKQFLDDIASADPKTILKNLDASLLILHSPQDRIVEIENASKLYLHASHPKSFVSLDGADHLLSNKQDSMYVGHVISAWASRYIETPEPSEEETPDRIKAPVAAILEGDKFTTEVYTRDHRFTADEPISLGGDNLGPGPFDLLLSSLGACTTMTLRMYINRKKWNVNKIIVNLNGSSENGVYKIHKSIDVDGDIDSVQLDRLYEISKKCPVSKVMLGEIEVVDWRE